MSDDLLNRLLYAATVLALTSVFVLDGNFTANLSRAINDEPLSLNPWEAGLGAAFAVAVGIALYREWKR
jgi:hypothetical protein